GVAFDLLGHFEQHIDFALLRAAFDHAGHDAHHPARAFPAGRALAAALMLVEGREAPDGLDDVGGLVHHDDRCRPHGGTDLAQPVEIDDGVLDLLTRHAGHRSPAGNDGQQIVPAAAHAAAMLFDDVLEALAHGFLE